MNLLPSDPEQRWNRLIAYGIAVFTVWVVLIIIGQIVGTNTGVKDDAALVIAVGGFLALLLGQVHHSTKIAETDAKVDAAKAAADAVAVVVDDTRAEVARATAIAEQVYEHVNNVEEQEAIPDGEPERPTLGSLLRRIDIKVDQGFALSREADERLQAQLDAVQRATTIEPIAPLPPPAPPAPAKVQPPRQDPTKRPPEKKPPPPAKNPRR